MWFAENFSDRKLKAQAHRNGKWSPTVATIFLQEILFRSVSNGAMEGSRRDLGSPKLLKRFCKFYEHEVLFQFSVLHESLDLLCGSINRFGMIRVLKSLPFSFLRYAVEDPFSVLMRHVSILPGARRAFARGPERLRQALVHEPMPSVPSSQMPP